MMRVMLSLFTLMILFSLSFGDLSQKELDQSKKEFIDSLTPVLINDEEGYIDKKENVIYHSDFVTNSLKSTWSEYRRMEKSKEGVWEFIIGRSGSAIYIDKYDIYPVGYFEIEIPLYPVKIQDKWGYIDRNGKIIIQPQYSLASVFTENMAAVRIGSHWGYIDTTGNILIQPEFQEASLFSDGVAPVKMNNQWGYIDTSGKMIIQPQFQDALPFQNKSARVKSNYKWGLIDKTGKILLRPRYYWIGPFSEGYAVCEESSEMWRYIRESDYKEQFRHFDLVNQFSNGLAPVKMRGQWYIMDTTGKFVYKPPPIN